MEISTIPQTASNLLVDEVVAETVRWVFRMTIEGKGVTEIANILTADKVLIHSAYFENTILKAAATITTTICIIGVLQRLLICLITMSTADIRF